LTPSPSESVPAGVRAILEALCFDRSTTPLPELSADDLAFADREHLTPLLSRFPLSPATKIYAEAALARNTVRMQRFRAAYDEIADKFDHIVLKGFTHAPDFIDDIRFRAQYDLDLYVPTAGHDAARDALLALGYEPIGSMEGLRMDHLPTMIRKTGWEWRGDYYDPDLPAGVEVHFRFWDAPTECIRVEGLEDFWTRREGHRLDRTDALGYAALHLTRHLLRGNVRVFHVWELARFLHKHQGDTDAGRAFWQQWQKQHSRSLRQIQAIAFLLAKSWFGCCVADEVGMEMSSLPPAVHHWFELYAWSPLEASFRPNKDELWLHMSLVASASDRWSILRRRLIPTSSPGPVASIHTPDDRLTMGLRISRTARNASYTASRAWFHARTLLPTLVEGARWWFRSRE
jgi:Uncharacterised nucleotidyltransferase